MSLFLLFLVTSIANIVTPGLGVALVVTLAAQYGWRNMLWGCWGLALGITVLFILALSGMGLVIAASPVLFAAIKVAGAIYIFWMAWQTWHKPPVNMGALENASSERNLGPGRALFGRCVVISLTNPQPLVFGVSVLPQFIDPQVSYLWQSVLYIVVYTILVFVFMVAYAVLASRARVFLAKGNGPLLMKRICAAVFVAIGIAVLISSVRGLMAM